MSKYSAVAGPPNPRSSIAGFAMNFFTALRPKSAPLLPTLQQKEATRTQAYRDGDRELDTANRDIHRAAAARDAAIADGTFTEAHNTTHEAALNRRTEIEKANARLRPSALEVNLDKAADHKFVSEQLTKTISERGPVSTEADLAILTAAMKNVAGVFGEVIFPAQHRENNLDVAQRRYETLLAMPKPLDIDLAHQNREAATMTAVCGAMRAAIEATGITGSELARLLRFFAAIGRIEPSAADRARAK